MGTKRKEFRILIIIYALVAFCFGTGLSYAYFTATLTTNPQTLTFGKLLLKVGDTTSSNTILLTQSQTKLSVGDTVTLKGSISTETGSVDAFVRMSINAEFTPETGKTISDETKQNFISAVFTQIAEFKDSTNTQKWYFPTTSSDKLYFANVFKGGTSYDYTGETITITQAMLADELQGSSVKLTFRYEAIQAGSTTAQSSLTANTYSQANATTIASESIWQMFQRQTVTIGDCIYTLSSNKQYYSVKGDGEYSNSNIVIEPYIDGTPVTTIEENGFYCVNEGPSSTASAENQGIISIKIPETITTLNKSSIVLYSISSEGDFSKTLIVDSASVANSDLKNKISISHSSSLADNEKAIQIMYSSYLYIKETLSMDGFTSGGGKCVLESSSDKAGYKKYKLAAD